MNVMTGSSLLLNSAGYQISRSVRLRSSASAYFNRTPASATNRRTFTWSGWVKRGASGDGTGSNHFFLFTAGTSTAFCAVDFYQNNIRLNFGNGIYLLVTSAVYRDYSSWYHIVVSVDTTQTTDTNRVKLYINGTQVTAFSTAIYPIQNYDTAYNNTVVQRIAFDGASNYFDGYLTEVNFIDGQALTPSSFGETNPVTGVWQPKKYTGTYGTNGFYLNFSDNSAATAAAIGKDYSGNSNNWTPNNISVTAGVTYDSMLDVPTQWADGGNGRGNYCVMNPLDKNASGTMAEGNLKWTAGAAQVCTRSTFAIPASGKFYMECLVGTASSPTVGISFGLAASTVALDTSSGATNLYQLYASTNRQINLNNSTTGSLSGGFSANDILQIAVDVDNQKMWLGVNNTWYNSAFTGNGDPVAGTNATSTASMVGFFPFSNCYQNSAYWNFGQRPFAYTPPSGFKALNTLNLPTPTILKGNQYFNAVLYSGNSGSQSITGVGFQPDLVWGKSRNIAENNGLFDAVRGVNKILYSNLTNAEATDPGVSAFNSDGFSLGGATINATGYTYVAWNWKAGGTPAVTNTAGSITSTVSVGATQGFSVVTFTTPGGSNPQTIGHGLGVAPRMIIMKSRNNVSGWTTYHASVGNTGALNLQATTATSTSIDWWQNTSPTSSVWSIGANLNLSTWTWVAYCFSEIAGFSKFGSYTGNGSTDGPMVFTGHLPRFIIIKRTDTTSAWLMADTVRQTYNVLGPYLTANTSDAETTGTVVLDVLSNGFKMRSATTLNASGGTYIFASFASNPFKNALAF